MQRIEHVFQLHGICHHLEHTGGSEKGVKIQSLDNADLVSDVLMVIDKHEHNLRVLVDDKRAGYAWLKLNLRKQPSPEVEKVLKYWNILGCIFGGDLYVDPGRTIDIFFSELQQLVKDSEQMRWKVKLSRHGLAIRMDVFPDSGVLLWGPRLYSVDLVPAYQVGGALYVSKPLEEVVPNRMTWRRSFSVQEKENPPDGAKCVLRALTAIRNHESDLEPLTLYHLKTVLFYEMDEEEDWGDHVLVQRFLCVLRRLEISLAFGNLPHYFYRETNLLSSMSSSSQRNMRDRIKRIRSSENELMEILKS